MSTAKPTVEAGPGTDPLTTNQGLRISDDNNSLRAGPRGPTLLEDFHFREKIQHFDHERIPERVVHARGTAVHGHFICTHPATDITMASPFAAAGKRTPIFVRFSTVLGSRGASDTMREVRGFAIKFYTETGVWDLVGNNIPVFFIQDAIKFPDLIHAGKPEPDTDIPQSASAHDTFWDFISLTPESAHMIMWAMSDRTLPRDFSMMEGFGVHTFRMVNAEGKGCFVKFVYKPVNGVHSMVWDEAQKTAGKDPDFHRRRLYNAIDSGNFPEWSFGVQVIPEEMEGKLGVEILDATKIIPEELIPVRELGRLVLDRNVDYFFGETEQAAFHPGHIIPGIDFSDDPLLQGRLFSYLDTQITRVGTNFHQIPINRATCPVLNHQRDGHMRVTVDKGKAAYHPNSLGNNNPAPQPKDPNAFLSYPTPVTGPRQRTRGETFNDHYSQATLFWNSLSDWEQAHLVAGASFELNNCKSQDVKNKMVNDFYNKIHPVLAQRIAKNTNTPLTAECPAPHDRKSPALSMDQPVVSWKGRSVAILVARGDLDHIEFDQVKILCQRRAMFCDVIGDTYDALPASKGSTGVDKPITNVYATDYDYVFVPTGCSANLLKCPLMVVFLSEAGLHGKPIAVGGTDYSLLDAARVKRDGELDKYGVVSGQSGILLVHGFTDVLNKHRYPIRQMETWVGSDHTKDNKK